MRFANSANLHWEEQQLQKVKMSAEKYITKFAETRAKTRPKELAKCPGRPAFLGPSTAPLSCLIRLWIQAAM